MRRGRGRKRGKPTISEVRKSATPIVVVCHSDDFKATEAFLSKTGRWTVVVYTPDTAKWWDRLGNSPRARLGPPSGPSCHVVAMYREVNRDQVQSAVKMVGERVEIATVALFFSDVPDNGAERAEFETVMPPETVATVADLAYRSVRELWAVQDAHDEPKSALLLSQVPDVCAWPPLMWRWNGTRLRDLCLRLRFQQDENSEGNDTGHEDEKKKSESENGGKAADDEDAARCVLRRDFEKKAASFLTDPDTERMADSVLSATSDACLFGRIHACASCAPWRHRDPKFLLAPDGAILNAFRYATSDCTEVLELVQFESEPPEGKFSIPMGNPMITACLLPALFRSGVEKGADAASQFDSVLGSRRIWEEHVALRACVLFMFEGRPGPLWQLAIRVVKTALPRTWEILFRREAAPDEAFLRALLHPDVVDAGRLRRDRGDGNAPLLPSRFEDMSRVYSLGRFVRTLRGSMPDNVMEDEAVRCSVSRTMKITPAQLDAVVGACKSGPVCPEACVAIVRIAEEEEESGAVVAAAASSAGTKEGEDGAEIVTNEARDVLAMLGMFLARDRRSVQDASRAAKRGVVDEGEVYRSLIEDMHAPKAMADCAMYCGTIHWLAVGDDEEDVWTCLPCLHRWQKRGAREAFQTRKLMHPMKMVPFEREEYYDPDGWDAIMEATGGDIAKLGVDYYWGRCSAEGCGRVCVAVPRSGACAETDGVPLSDFPEDVVLNDGSTLRLRQSLEGLGLLGPNQTVTSDSLEKFFNSEEKLTYLPGPVRRRVRNCVDKSTYILPRGILCDKCGVPDEAVEDYCPYCGTGFEPVFACVRYSCPHCSKVFCKACLGIDGIHYDGVYSTDHVCWKVLGNRYSYHNKGFCAKCKKERPWPESHALVSAGPEIRNAALGMDGGMPLEVAVGLQSSNLKAFTERYAEGVEIFERCSHTEGLMEDYCHCGTGVTADEYDEGGYGYGEEY